MHVGSGRVADLASARKLIIYILTTALSVDLCMLSPRKSIASSSVQLLLLSMDLSFSTRWRLTCIMHIYTSPRHYGFTHAHRLYEHIYIIMCNTYSYMYCTGCRSVPRRPSTSGDPRAAAVSTCMPRFFATGFPSAYEGNAHAHYSRRNRCPPTSCQERWS